MEESTASANPPQNPQTNAKRTRPSLTRFASLSFINEALASEVLAGNEKLFKQALFNAAANIFVLLAVLAFIAVFFVLEIFLRPLLWATLTGSFLYPFKKAATDGVKNWLKGLTRSRTPLFIGLLLVPFNLVNRLSDTIGHFVSQRVYLFATVLLSYPVVYALFTFTPIRFLFTFVLLPINLLFRANSLLSATWLRFISPYFWTLFVAYFLFVFVYSAAENSAAKFTYASLAAWALMLYHLFITSSGFIVLTLIILSFVALSGYARLTIKPKNKIKIRKLERAGSFDETSQHKETTPLGNRGRVLETSSSLSSCGGETNPSPASSSASQSTTNMVDFAGKAAVWVKNYSRQVFATESPNQPTVTIEESSNESSSNSNEEKSNIKKKNFNDTVVSYGFYLLGWAILTIQTLKHLWILPALFLPITVFVVKRSFLLFGLDHILMPYLKSAKDKLYQSKDVLMPSAVQSLVQFYLEGDRRVIKMLKGSIGIVVSILLVSLLFVGTLILSFLLAAQIQEEAMAVVEIGTTLAQEMAISYPQFKTFSDSVFPNNTDIQSSLTMVVERGYGYSRDLIEKWIQMYIVEGGDTKGAKSADAKSHEIAEQLLAVYDQIYLQLWVNRNQTSNQTLADVFSNVKSLYGDADEDSKSTQSLISSGGFLKAMQQHGEKLFRSGYDIVNGNFDTLRSVALSLWSILHSNINLVLYVLTSLVWIILSSGSHIMNFLISFVVFLTALFYLLSLSGSRYKPMEFIASIMPANAGSASSSVGGIKSFSQQNTFADAVNNAIMGVFGASIKLSAFYGLLTYITHTVAGVRLVFFPAAVAAILGAVPVFGTYIACIPAVLELWLLHDEFFAAVFLLVAHLLPTYGGFDTAIYAQISGAGHPYFTGLAVVGGISVKGLEGAILGPILLCVLLVVSNVYTSYIASGSGEEGNSLIRDSNISTPSAAQINEQESTPVFGDRNPCLDKSCLSSNVSREHCPERPYLSN